MHILGLFDWFCGSPFTFSSPGSESAKTADTVNPDEIDIGEDEDEEEEEGEEEEGAGEVINYFLF